MTFSQKNLTFKTTWVKMFYIMIESVFREIIKQSTVTSVQIQEVLPSKGKPAKNKEKGATVWIVIVCLGEEHLTLESARGGAREWASLNNLDKWLRSFGIESYTINHKAGGESPQLQLALN